MKSSSHRRAAQSAFDGLSLQELPSNGLPDIIASKRGAALMAYVNRPRGTDPDETASRIAGMISLDPDTGPQDFEVSLEHRRRAIEKLLDPSAAKTLLALSDGSGNLRYHPHRFRPRPLPPLFFRRIKRWGGAAVRRDKLVAWLQIAAVFDWLI